MLNNLLRLFKPSNSKDIAKNRLKLVLLGDRTVPAEVLENIRLEFMEVLYKYLDIDKDNLCIKFSSCPSEDGTLPLPALIANIPIKGVKR